MTVASNEEAEQSGSSSQADALFKEITRLEALSLGMQAGETEQQYTSTTRADLILHVPPGVNLAGTLFDFFRQTNIIEFKSQNDRFTLRQYMKNDLRTTLHFLQSRAKNFDAILNVVVSSRLPQQFFEVARRRGLVFQPEQGRPWLWRGQIGFQDVVIVVCRDLPLEESFYEWLLFAPTDTVKWRKYAFEVIYGRKTRWVELIKQMRPKEFAMLTDEIFEQIKAKGLLEPVADEQYLKDLAEGAKILLRRLSKEQAEELEEVLSELAPQDRLAGLNVADRLAGLNVADRLAGLSPEERQTLLNLLSQPNPNNETE